MADTILIALTHRERELILQAFDLITSCDPAADEVEAIRQRIDLAKSSNITVGVHGGQVQWIFGSPVAIRVCDYDGEPDDLPDRDEDDLPCRIWFDGTAARHP